MKHPLNNVFQRSKLFSSQTLVFKTNNSNQTQILQFFFMRGECFLQFNPVVIVKRNKPTSRDKRIHARDLITDELESF